MGRGAGARGLRAAHLGFFLIFWCGGQMAKKPFGPPLRAEALSLFTFSPVPVPVDLDI